MVAAPTFSIPFVDTPAYYSGTAQTNVVPSVYPVAINGRPYLIDMKSGRYVRSHEQRVRDSQDNSTAPGEAAINPGGLWRRGQDSWHYGAGQQYADTAEAKDYMFYKSKGVNPWVKGQISLHHTTKLSLNSAATTNHMVACGTHLYASLNGDVKYTTNPYGSITATITNVSASAGTVTYTAAAHGFTAGSTVDITGVNPSAYNLSGVTIATVSTNSFTVTNAATGTFVSGGTAVQHIWVNCTGEPGGSCQAMATDGNDVYFAFPADGVRKIDTSVDPAVISGTKFVNSNDSYYMLGFAKNYMWGSHSHVLNTISSGGSKTAHITPDDTAFIWVGVATGQNAVYAAGYSGQKSLIYKITIKSDGTLDAGVVALELPTGEIATAISGYLGSIILGTNKGVRYCTTDANSNLIAGPIIPTSGSVRKITSEGKYSWFTWSNYDGVSTGLGRLDLSTLTGANTPAFATDLMYTSTSDASSVATFDSKRIFFVQAIGIVCEDTTTVVPSGEIEFGTYRWGIPDRKFVAKFDVRTEPLLGTVTAYLSNDHSSYASLGTFSTQSGIENTYQGSDTKTIEADFKLVLTKGTVDTDDSPIVTRWMARAYAAPFRSEVFSIPVLLHTKIRPRDRDIYMDPEQELNNLNSLIHNPRIVTLQLGTSSYSVITEDVEWQPIDSTGNTWSWDGTATVTMRSVEN